MPDWASMQHGSSSVLTDAAIRKQKQRRINAGIKIKLQQRCFSKHKPQASPPKLSLTFKRVRARDQTRLPCEFGTKPFRDSGDISYTNQKVTAPKTEPYAVHCVL